MKTQQNTKIDWEYEKLTVVNPESRTISLPTTLAPAIVRDLEERCKSMISSCPQPTRGEIHKLMAMQAHFLNEYAIICLKRSDLTQKNKKFYLDYAMQLFDSSKTTFESLLSDPSLEK